MCYVDLRELLLETPLGVEVELGVQVLFGHHPLTHDPAMAQHTALSFPRDGEGAEGDRPRLPPLTRVDVNTHEWL